MSDLRRETTSRKTTVSSKTSRKSIPREAEGPAQLKEANPRLKWGNGSNTRIYAATEGPV